MKKNRNKYNVKLSPNEISNVLFPYFYNQPFIAREDKSDKGILEIKGKKHIDIYYRTKNRRIKKKQLKKDGVYLGIIAREEIILKEIRDFLENETRKQNR